MTKPKKVSFEESLKALEGVVTSLEGGQMPLETSISQFEEGMKLVSECETVLRDAEGKVEKLIKDTAGNKKTVNFDPKEG